MSSFARLAVTAFALVLSLAGSAAAQTKPTGYGYRFEPDDLVGETLSTTPPLLTVRPLPLRVTLLRPRVSFVPEVLQTIERM